MKILLLIVIKNIFLIYILYKNIIYKKIIFKFLIVFYLMADSIGMMEGAFFVSKGEIMSWVNNLLQINITKVE